jgi:hypothetical protein
MHGLQPKRRLLAAGSTEQEHFGRRVLLLLFGWEETSSGGKSTDSLNHAKTRQKECRWLLDPKNASQRPFVVRSEAEHTILSSSYTIPVYKKERLFETRETPDTKMIGPRVGVAVIAVAIKSSLLTR